MSNGHKSGYPVGPEKANYADKREKHVEIFRGYRIPKSVGIVIDASKVKTVVIDQETLQRNLRNQEAVIVIPLGKGNEACKTVYLSEFTGVKGGTNECDPNCETAQYYSSYGYDCKPRQEENLSCACEDEGSMVINCCPIVA